MIARTSYFLGFIGALGFTLGILGTSVKRSNTPFANNHIQETFDLGIEVDHYFEDGKIDFLKTRITPETIKELSDLIKTNLEGTAEVGGEFYFIEKRVRFYPAPNQNLQTIEELENRNLEDHATFAYMKELLDSRFSGTGHCMPGNSDVNWQYRIKKTREAIEDSEKEIGDSTIALNNLIENLKDTYVKGDVIGYPRGIFLGDLHTHNNGTGFSDVDLCISHSRTLFLVSHNHPNSNMFNLYVAKNGKVVDLGGHNIN